MVVIDVIGPLRVTASDGSDITPSGKKARGLLALLATSSELRRSRAWLQDKLWSDRSQQQGSASLRHAVWQIRKSFGDRDILRSENDCLFLASANVRRRGVSFDSHEYGSELFEGLDIKDEEFNAWLRDQRARKPLVHTRTEPTSVFSILFKRHSDSDGEAKALTKTSSHRIESYFKDKFGAEIIFLDSLSKPQETLDVRLVINIETLKVREGYIWSIEVGDFYSNFSLCSHSVFLSDRINFDEKASKIDDLIIKLSLHLESDRSFWRRSVPQSAYRLRALKKAQALLFSLDKQSMASADILLSSLPRESWSPEIFAWRALLRSVGWFQYRETSYLSEDCDEWQLLESALQGDEPNSATYAVAALAENLSGSSPKRAVRLATAAFEMNPLDPLASVVLSNCLISLGDNNAALEVSRAFGKTMHLSSMQPYIDFFGCMAEEANGNYLEAISKAERSMEGLRVFRSPKRHLVALYKATGQVERSRDMIRELKAVEPDFSERRMLDDDYPAHTLRKIKLSEYLNS